MFKWHGCVNTHRARYVWIITLYCHHRARWFPIVVCYDMHQRISLWMIHPYHHYLLHELITSAVSFRAMILLRCICHYHSVKPVNYVITIMFQLCAIYLCLCLYHMRIDYMPLTLPLMRINLMSFAFNSHSSFTLMVYSLCIAHYLFCFSCISLWFLKWPS